MSVPRGKYVVAVSGGVDSMVLLDILAKQAKSQKPKAQSSKKNFQLIAAHFNHGIRDDSKKDEEFVRRLAEDYGMPFEVGYGRLGADASEEEAREARYEFLESVKKKHRADSIITAHHQDDVLETALINIIRGTGRRGLTAIADNPNILRPMLAIPKSQVLAYAKTNNLQWREDATNEDEKYLRNYIRRQILPALDSNMRRKLLGNIENLSYINAALNQEIAKMSQKTMKDNVIYRGEFIALPAEIAREILMLFLRDNGITGFDKPAIERLVVAIKTAKAGTKHEIIRGFYLEIMPSKALLRTTVNG